MSHWYRGSKHSILSQAHLTLWLKENPLRGHVNLDFKIVHVEEEKETIQPGLNNISEIFTPKPIIVHLMYSYPLVLLSASHQDTKGPQWEKRWPGTGNKRNTACTEDTVELYLWESITRKIIQNKSPSPRDNAVEKLCNGM